MKRILALFAGIILLVGGCSKVENNQVATEDLSAPTGRKCTSHEMLQQQLAEDPGFARRFAEIEEFTQEVLRNPQQYKLVNGVMEIPVVVNVLYKTSAEKAVITTHIDVLNTEKAFNNPIVTQIMPFTIFYEAEDYHQDFEARNPNNPYVRAVSVPRLLKFKAKFPKLLKASH